MSSEIGSLDTTWKKPFVTDFLSLILKFTNAMHEKLTLLESKGYSLCEPDICHIVYCFLEESTHDIDIVDTFIRNSKHIWLQSHSDRFFFVDNSRAVLHNLDENFILLFEKVYTSRYEDNNFVISDQEIKSYLNIAREMILVCVRYIEKRRELEETYQLDLDVGEITSYLFSQQR